MTLQGVSLLTLYMAASDRGTTQRRNILHSCLLEKPATDPSLLPGATHIVISLVTFPHSATGVCNGLFNEYLEQIMRRRMSVSCRTLTDNPT